MRWEGGTTAGVILVGVGLSVALGSLSVWADEPPTRGIQVSFEVQGGPSRPVSLYDNMIAVIIGIDRYENLPSKDQLNYAVKDAEGVKSVLEQRYPVKEIYTLFNQ